MNLKPLSDRVVVKPITESETTKSGIVIPETAQKEKPEKGEIIAVGPGKMMENGNRAAMNVAVGNKVMFKKYSPDEVKVDGQTLLILDESDLLAIIE